MSPEAQNEAIAEACGEVYHKPTEKEIASGSYYQYEPNYFGDLNTMYMAEKAAINGQSLRISYAQEIDRVTMIFEQDSPYSTAYGGFIHVDSEKRAEAFLRTLGKWIDEQ